MFGGGESMSLNWWNMSKLTGIGRLKSWVQWKVVYEGENEEEESGDALHTYPLISR